MARSHKGGLGSLAATTDIYLRDATFAGYDPSYILRQLLERGPMSWVAVRFLEHQDKEAFRSITVAGQTALVRDLGLSPLQLESLWGACSAAGTLAQTAVAAVFYGGGTPRERLGEVLEGMARGGRDACVCRATGGTCREPGRGSCLWCPHSLLAPALATEVMKEYVGLQEKLHALEEGPNRKRLEAILEDGCLPVVRGLQEMAGGKCPAVRRIIREAALMVREMEDNKDKRK